MNVLKQESVRNLNPVKGRKLEVFWKHALFHARKAGSDENESRCES